MKHVKIDRYEIVKALGKGTSGSVFLAQDPKVGRQVAIKILKTEFAKNPKHRDRFEREARAIATLNHPNIVDIYDFGGTPEDHLFLVMEFVPGLNLGQLAQKHSPLSETALVAIGVELSAALSHAHQTSIIHRDLKPENVFLNQGRLVLADFGIAKAITPESPLSNQRGPQTTEIIGTPGFMSPEQLRGEPLDAAADIFAFGALLYFLATGKLPYRAASPYLLLNTMRETRPTPIEELRPEFSKRFSRLIQECLSCEPDQRPDSMATIRKGLTVNLKHLGGGDVRQLLAECEADPALFDTHSHLRTIDYLMDQLKIATRDHNTDYAHVIETRLSTLSLSPHQSEEVKDITAPLPSSREAAPEELFESYRKRRRRRNTIALLGLLVAIASWWATNGPRYFPSDAPTSAPIKAATATLRVDATHPTSVFINGSAGGTTPGFPTVQIPEGKSNFEFIGPNRASLTRQIDVFPKTTLLLKIDWNKKLISVIREPSAAPGSKEP